MLKNYLRTSCILVFGLLVWGCSPNHNFTNHLELKPDFAIWVQKQAAVVDDAFAQAAQKAAQADSDYVEAFSQILAKESKQKLVTYFIGGAGMEGLDLTMPNESIVELLQGKWKEDLKTAKEKIIARASEIGKDPVDVEMQGNTMHIGFMSKEYVTEIKAFISKGVKLHFLESYYNFDIVEKIDKLNELLKVKQQEADTLESNYGPIFNLLSPTLTEESAVMGVVRLADTAEVIQLLSSEEAKNRLPTDLRLLWQADVTENSDGDTLCYLYAAKTGNSSLTLDGRYVESAYPTAGFNATDFAIFLQFDNVGAEIWAKMTEQNIGRHLLISIDGLVISAPRVNEAITGGSVQISGGFDAQEAGRLARALDGGGLPVTFSIEAEFSTNPE